MDDLRSQKQYQLLATRSLVIASQYMELVAATVISLQVVMGAPEDDT